MARDCLCTGTDLRGKQCLYLFIAALGCTLTNISKMLNRSRRLPNANPETQSKTLTPIPKFSFNLNNETLLLNYSTGLISWNLSLVISCFESAKCILTFKTKETDN